MAVDPVAQTAAITLALARKAGGRAPVRSVATAVTSTNEAGKVSVTLAAGDAPVEAQVVGGPVAEGEQVETLWTPDGTLLVLGSVGGQPRLLDVKAIAALTANQNVVSTAATELAGLRCEFVIPHPNHLVEIEVAAIISSSGANNSLRGVIHRLDTDDGTIADVGFFLYSNQMGNNQTILAGPPVRDYAPDPGSYEYYPTVEATVTGFSMITNHLERVPASMTVKDAGALPVGSTHA